MEKHMQFVHDILDISAMDFPEKDAIITSEHSINYGRLREKSMKVATYLKSIGVGKGDRVLILLPNSVETVYLLMAISRLGAIAVILNQGTSEYNLKYIINDCKPKLVIHKDSLLIDLKLSSVISIDKIEFILADNSTYCNIKENFNSKVPALIIYTSGSTGEPKGVLSSHDNIVFCTKAISNQLKLDKSDIIGNFLPFSFDYGLYQVFKSI